jgi:hypothetical protein
MRIPEISRRATALFVLIAFAGLLHVAAAPLGAASEKIVNSSSTGAIEQPGAAGPAVKKHSILPKILIAVGVLGVAAAVYFLVIKKKTEELHDEFNSSDSLWLPRHANYWTLGGGLLKCQAPAGAAHFWEWNIYNKAWSKPDMTVTARLRHVSNYDSVGINLTTGGTPGSFSGYQFQFWPDGRYMIRTLDGYNMETLDSKATMIKDWTGNSAIKGLGEWNTFKIVRSGTTYTLYANDVSLFSFTNATYDPRYVSLDAIVYVGHDAEFEFDSVTVDLAK